MSLTIDRGASLVQSSLTEPILSGWEGFYLDQDPNSALFRLERYYNEVNGQEVSSCFRGVVDNYFPEEPSLAHDLKLAIGELLNNTIVHGLPGSTRHADLMVFRGPILVLRTENVPNPDDRRHTCSRSRIDSLPEKEHAAQLSPEELAKALDILMVEIDESATLVESLNMGHVILDMLPSIEIEHEDRLCSDNIYRAQATMPKRQRLTLPCTYAC